MTEQDRWEEARRSLCLKLGLLLSIVGWLQLFGELGSRDLDLGLVCLLLAGAIALPVVSVLTRPSATAVALAQLALLLAVVLACCGLLGYRGAVPFLVLPLLLGSFLLPLWLAVPAGLVMCSLPLLLTAEPVMMDWASLTLLLVAVGAVALIQASSGRSLLFGAWSQTEQMNVLAREVRLRQEEVNRLNKALKVSNGLLKRSLNELGLAQREAQEARQLKEQFATTVSHELRTPLNIILGFVEVMQRYPEVYIGAVWTPALRRDVTEIQRSARYLSELIDDVLDLARLQALKMPVRRERADIRLIIEEATDLASRLLLDKRDIHIQRRVPRDLPDLSVDRTRIRQVLLNLLANACRFTERGEITVAASLREEEVVVSVSDTGPGVSPVELERIFEEFQQTGGIEPEGSRQTGKGLGLAIAKRFVQMHGGRIWVESTPGEGSTFSFSIPLQEKQVVYLSEPDPGALPRDKGVPTVVLVDEPEGRSFLSRRLEGYHVLLAADMQEARRLIHQDHPHALILNVPPEPEGALHGTPPPLLSEPLPVIQCSLPVSHNLMEGEFFDDWLVKPIDGQRLVSALGQMSPQDSLLIVDDDPSFVRLVRRLLEAQETPCRVSWAHDAQEALQKAREERSNIVLLDIALPGLSGRWVAQTMRQEYGEEKLKIIAVTATQPGTEGTGRHVRSLAVTSAAGLSEDDTLALLNACLIQLKPTYSLSSPTSEPQAAEAGTPVW